MVTNLRKTFFILTLILCRAATQGLQGQTIRWQSAFEQNAFRQAATDPQAAELACLIAVDGSATDSTLTGIHGQLTGLCQQLAKRRRKFVSESQFLFYAFQQVRQRYLHRYQPYPPFTSVFQDSIYNCLSGTALYAYVLHRIGFAVEIRETNQHAYLRVKSVRSEYLIDATDPQNGFVSDDELLIARREFWYATNELRHGKAYNEAISLTQLAGLQYFNEAVKAFNRRAYGECAAHLAKAGLLYPNSEKITALQKMAQPHIQPTLAAQSRISK